MRILRRRRETELRERVVWEAAQLGVRSLQLDLRHDAGWPDRVFLTPFQPLWLEFKRPGKEPRPLQVHRMQILEGLGYDVGWTDNYTTAMDRIHRALQRKS